MTVEKLIKELGKYPGETVVFRFDSSFSDAGIQKIREGFVDVDAHFVQVSIPGQAPTAIQVK